MYPVPSIYICICWRRWRRKCARCSSNGAYSTEGASYCSIASAGYEPTSLKTDQVQCQPEEYSTGAADACEACAVGEIIGLGAAGCNPCSICAPGRYKTSTCTTSQETQCQECQLGTFSAGGLVKRMHSVHGGRSVLYAMVPTLP